MFLQVTVTRTSALSNDIGIWKDGCIEILEVRPSENRWVWFQVERTQNEAGFEFKVKRTKFWSLDNPGDAEEGLDRVPVRLGVHRGRPDPRPCWAHHRRPCLRLCCSDQQVRDVKPRRLTFFIFLNLNEDEYIPWMWNVADVKDTRGCTRELLLLTMMGRIICQVRKLTFQKYEAWKKCPKKKTKTNNMPGGEKLTISKCEMCSIYIEDFEPEKHPVN